MYQLRFPYILYFKNLRIADTPNSGHLRIADSFSGTKALANTFIPDTITSAHLDTHKPRPRLNAHARDFLASSDSYVIRPCLLTCKER